MRGEIFFLFISSPIRPQDAASIHLMPRGYGFKNMILAFSILSKAFECKTSKGIIDFPRQSFDCHMVIYVTILYLFCTLYILPYFVPIFLIRKSLEIKQTVGRSGLKIMLSYNIPHSIFGVVIKIQKF